jgi:hypothetical protein
MYYYLLSINVYSVFFFILPASLQSRQQTFCKVAQLIWAFQVWNGTRRYFCVQTLYIMQRERGDLFSANGTIWKHA